MAKNKRKKREQESKKKRDTTNSIHNQEVCLDAAVYASEEINRWLRNIESSMWMIASILLGATGVAIVKFMEIYQPNDCNPYRILVSLFMFVLWIIFLCFLKDISLKSQDYVKKSEKWENILKININQYGCTDIKSIKLEKGYHGRFYRAIMFLVFFRIPLMTAMAAISWGMIIFWGCATFAEDTLFDIFQRVYNKLHG